MKSAIKVLHKQITHFYLIRRLSLYELKSRNKNNYLGIAWEFINPSIQILIYWFVFGTLLQRAPVDVLGEEIPFFSWLLAAFFLWIFFYQATIQGSKSIYSRLKMLSKMNFPISIIPSYIIFSQFYVHILMMVIAAVILQISGHNIINMYTLQIFYFMFGLLALIFAISLITSTLSTIIRDIHMFLNATLRMFLYVSGVLWPITILADYPIVMQVMKLNPLYYLIEGYRTAFFGSEWYFITNWEYSLYFWGVVIVLLLFGSQLHVRFRKHFIDYL